MLFFCERSPLSACCTYPGGYDPYGSSPRQEPPQQPRRTPARAPSPSPSSRGLSGSPSPAKARSAERSATAAAAVADDGFGDLDAILGGSFDADLGRKDQEDRYSSSSSSEDVSVGDGGGGDSSSGSGSGSGGSDAAREEIGGLKVPELKERCKALGLKVGGKKAELQARILEALQ